MKKVVVTGGSSGIGRDIVLSFLEKGFKVIFTYKNAKDSAEEIGSKYPLATPINVDFSVQNQLDSFLADIDYFQPDILVNNYYSGVFISDYFHKTKPGVFHEEFLRNVIPTLAVTQRCISVFRKKKFGRIITILSSSLRSPAQGSSAYNSNKAYLLQMSRHWALENVKFGITSNCISPAFIPTDFHKGMDARLSEIISSSYPIVEKPTTGDVANLVSMCVQGGAHFNGNHLFLDVTNY